MGLPLPVSSLRSPQAGRYLQVFVCIHQEMMWYAYHNKDHKRDEERIIFIDIRRGFWYSVRQKTKDRF